jgi:hypothetical protein
MVSCPRASSSVPHIEGEVAKERLTVFAPGRTVLRQVADDGSRWRGPGRNHGSHAVVQNGSAASELPADAHYCILVWVSVPTAYKDVGMNNRAPHAGLPSTSSSPTRANCAVVLGALKDEPSVALTRHP